MGLDRNWSGSHHSYEVSSTIFSHQLLLAVCLADDRTQAAIQNDVGAVRLVILPVDGKGEKRPGQY